MSGSFKITDLHHPWTTIIIILLIQRQGLNILSSNTKTETLLLPLRESHNHQSKRSPPSMQSRNLWRRLKLPWNLSKLSHYPRILPHSQVRSSKPNSKTTWRDKWYRGQEHLTCKLSAKKIVWLLPPHLPRNREQAEVMGKSPYWAQCQRKQARVRLILVVVECFRIRPLPKRQPHKLQILKKITRGCWIRRTSLRQYIIARHMTCTKSRKKKWALAEVMEALFSNSILQTL